MRSKKTIFIGIFVLLIIIMTVAIGFTVNNQKRDIDSYDKCALAGYPILESYPEQCAVPGGKTYTRVTTQDMPISLEGKTTCLLHKNMDEPHTMECTIGLKTDEEKYYGLGTKPYDNSLNTTNRRVRVNGTLNHNPSTMYQSEGTVTVTSYEFLD